MNNLFKLNMSRVRVSKHRHSKRVAYQKEIDSGFVQKLRGGIVVGRESRNPLMSSLRASDGIGSNLIHYLTMDDGVEGLCPSHSGLREAPARTTSNQVESVRALFRPRVLRRTGVDRVWDGE